MSRDVFIQDLPAHIDSLHDVPDDWRPRPLPLGAAKIRAAIMRLRPTVDFTDPTWGHLQLPDASIEINLADQDPLYSFALHIRGHTAGPDAFITDVLHALNLRAIDPSGSPTTGIFGNG